MNKCLESNPQLVSIDSSSQQIMVWGPRNQRAAFRSENSSWFPAVMLFLVLSFIGSALRAERLDDLWTITAGGQRVEVNLDGTFLIPNVASVDQDGDRIADDFLRIIGTARIGGVDLYAAGGYFRVRGGRKVTVSNEFSIRTSPPQKPERLGASVLIPTLTALGQTTLIRVTATYADGSSAEANGSIAGTSYRTSNPDIGTVSSEGVVTAVSQGLVFITAVNEGVSSVVTVIVAPGSGFTSVAGFVRRQDGAPAIGSVVSISALGLSAIVGTDGSFSFTGVPTSFGAVTVTAQFIDNGSRLVAVARQVSLVPNGISDAGLMSLAPFSVDRVGFIASGRNHAGGIRKDGSLWTWGQNSSGQLGDETNLSRFSPVRVGADLNWVAISAGVDGSFTCALKTDGSLWTWGSNDGGQLGLGSTGGSLRIPRQVGTDNDWAMVSAGNRHAAALRTDGTLWAWGVNSSGQLGNGTTTGQTSPTRIGTEADWAMISTGNDHTVALKVDGSLWGWGSGGVVGDGTSSQRLSPVRIGSDNNWMMIAASQRTTVALRRDGSLWTWGSNVDGQIGDGSTTARLSPVRVGTENDWAFVGMGEEHALAVKIDGSLWAWGSNTRGKLGDGTFSSRLTPIRIGTDNDWVAAFGGDDHTIALKMDGSLWGWGSNRSGELGDGTGGIRSSPVRLGSDNDWAAIEAGILHSLALKTDGRLWAWGNNLFGQFGNGTTITRLTPVAIGTDTDWAQISTGDLFHSLGLKTDGTLRGWGSNFSGEVGDGTTDNRFNPVAVGTNNDWAVVHAGREHSVALKKNGSLWAWGANDFGQLGTGTAGDHASPTPIGADADWAVVSAGYEYNMAIKADRSLWGWGQNNNGQLGDGSTGNKLVPIRIGTDSDWATVCASDDHTVAIKTDGSLWAWGLNASGQLGDGTTTINRLSPVRIGADNDWARVSAGIRHNLALKRDGSLWLWGGNSSGQLGDGSTINKLAPARLGTDNNWISIAGGASHSLALKADRSLWVWGDYDTGALGLPFVTGPIGGFFDWGSPVGAPIDPAARLTSLVTVGPASDPGDFVNLPVADGTLRITSLTHSASGTQFHFPTEAGRRYRLEGSADLAATRWETLVEHFTGTGEVFKMSDPNAANLPRYFYRIVLLP